MHCEEILYSLKLALNTPADCPDKTTTVNVPRVQAGTYVHVQFPFRKAAERKGTSDWLHLTELLPQVVLRLKVVEQVTEEVVNDIGFVTLTQSVHINGSSWDAERNELVGRRREVRVRGG